MSTDATSSHPMSSSATQPLHLTLIAAVSPTNGLGRSGGLPWRLPKEMAYFRRATSFIPASTTRSSDGMSRNAVLMGRNTWNSIPPKFRPLAGRVNVVVSSLARPREGSDEDEGTARERAQKELGIDPSQDAHVFSDLSSACAFLTSPSSKVSRTFLIGGAQLYAQALKEMVPGSSAATTTQGAVLDRLLITRIFEPAFDECDVFLPEFRSGEEVGRDLERGGSSGDVQTEEEQAGRDWKRSGAEELRAWLGEEEDAESQVGQIVEEKGARYEFQMWVRP